MGAVRERTPLPRGRRLATAVSPSVPRGNSQTCGPSSANVAARIAPGRASTAFTPYKRQTLRMARSRSPCAFSMAWRSLRNSSGSPSIRPLSPFCWNVLFAPIARESPIAYRCRPLQSIDCAVNESAPRRCTVSWGGMIMLQHRPPSIGEFVNVSAREWLTLMSGILTVPFSFLAFWFPNVRWIFEALAACAFAFTVYRIWFYERRQLVDLEAHLAPRLRIEFDPLQPKFVSPTRVVGSLEMLYVRVLARAISPVVEDCRAYLLRISQLEGERYVPLFEEPLLLPWSYENPKSVQPKDLNHDVDAFVDVAWFTDPASGRFHFGILNADSVLPIRLTDILQDHLLPQPERNIKLDLLLTGENSESATLSLNIHRAQPRWNQPTIGWMDSIGMIRMESNIDPR
jgi:hypothetical protein